MQLKIIYVDDEPELCEMFKENFESETLAITTYTDSKEAIRNILKESPDLLILDYRMPNTTGDEIASKVAANIPKILITGDLAVQPREKFLKIFNKPFNFDEMGRYLNNFRATKKAA